MQDHSANTFHINHAFFQKLAHKYTYCCDQVQVTGIWQEKSFKRVAQILFSPLLLCFIGNEIRVVRWKNSYSPGLACLLRIACKLFYLKLSYLKIYNRPPLLPKHSDLAVESAIKFKQILKAKHFFSSPSLEFLSIWRKYLPTVNAAVCPRVRA